MTERIKIIMFGDGRIYELDTEGKDLLFVCDNNIPYDGDIPVDIEPYPEFNVESFLERNPEYKIIKGMEE